MLTLLYRGRHIATLHVPITYVKRVRPITTYYEPTAEWTPIEAAFEARCTFGEYLPARVNVDRVMSAPILARLRRTMHIRPRMPWQSEKRLCRYVECLPPRLEVERLQFAENEYYAI